MNPQSGAISARIEATLAEPSAETGTTSVPVEQFIWEDAAPPADAALPEGSEIEADDQDVTAETSGDNDEGLTRIVVLSEDEEETSDSWRRQLISALRDADRDASHTKSLPTEPPPIPPVEIPRRPPITFVASHTARTAAAPPVERRPRNRMAPVLFGISAAAGLLAIAVPRVANTPEAAADAATVAPIMTGALVPTAGDDTLKPIIMNSPVLVREGLSRGPQTALPVGPVIETVRTVPVQIGARSPAGMQASEAAPIIEPPAVPVALPQLPPIAAPPLDRERLAALIYDEPAAPPAPSAAAVSTPGPAEPAEKTTSAPTEAKRPAKARSPQVSSAYQRSIRETRHTKSASKKRAPTKTASRSSDRAKWDARRQGLRTAPPSNQVKEVEPSTMVKLLKSLNPFASKEESQARPKKNIFE